MSKSDDFKVIDRERIELDIEDEKVIKARSAFTQAMSDAAIDFYIENIKDADWDIGSKGIIEVHFNEMFIKKSLVDLVREAISPDSLNDEDDIESIKSALLQCLDILNTRD